MGEVYKARDSRLDRTVAIKVLPATTSMSDELRSRFDREAKAISSLNHPNICTLHDIGHENGMDYLVMEYLEGETLSDRIKRSPLDLNEALDIATQIANALDSAHRQNLIHRDLKPANVMLTKSGAKLLDFGLAKLQFSEGPAGGTAAVTQTTPLTGASTIIGTIQYMSPEQLEGQQADTRSDIFAFGAVLYELVTGQKAFDGKSQASLIAAIMEKEPSPVAQVKPTYPPALERLIRKCLEKDPEKRWQSARDLSDELKWIAQSGSQAGVSAAVSSKRRFRFRLAWAAAAVMTIIAAVAIVQLLTQTEPELFVRRFNVEAGSNVSSANWPQISPDGRLIAFIGRDSTNTSRIWIRPMNSLESYPLPGTESPGRPFWSPDSKHLAFFSGDQLKRIAVSGGPAQLLGEAKSGADGAWGASGIILFDGGSRDSIRAIPASGGPVTAATIINRTEGESFHAWPQFLPDGEHFLFLAGLDSSVGGQDYKLKVGSINSKETVSLVTLNSLIKFAPPEHLLYIRDGILLAQRFDAGNLEVIGDPIPITDQVTGFGSSAGANFSVSNDGTLIMMTDSKTEQSQIKWFDRSGKELETLGEPQRYSEVALSPNNNRFIFSLEDDEESDLWVYDQVRSVSTKFTFEEGVETVPFWTPDGKNVIYTTGQFPNFESYSKPSDGSGNAVKLVWKDSVTVVAGDISYDGKSYVNIVVRNNQPDIASYSATDYVLQTEIANSEFAEWAPQFSPNNNYVLFISNESGKTEVYVKRADGQGGKWQVSIGGGYSARWSKDGKEIIYWAPGRTLKSVPVNITGTFEAGKPKELFKQRLSSIGAGNKRWDISKDGQKFLLLTPVETNVIPSFEVVLNWTKELEERW